jgi:hypothetical protein
MADNNTFPKISEGNWWKIRELFKKTIPTVVNKKYLAINLDMSEVSAKTNILPALFQLGIIDDQGKPTELANLWRDDDQYPTLCKKVVESVYPKELLDICPGPNPDKLKVFKWFATTKALGESAAQKISSTYIFLISGKINSEATNSSRKPSPSKADKINSKPKEKLQKHNERQNTESERPNHTQGKYPNVHIDLQIHISPESSSELVDKIFESIKKHLYPNE